MGIRVEDRGIVVAVATQIFCARVQANSSKHGYSPDLALCVGEAAALVRQVDTHIAPTLREEAIRERRKNRPKTVEINLRGQL